jgi:hypothetical protein
MYQLTVKDLQGNILHQPTLATLEEALAMKLDIEAFHNYNFPAHVDEQGILVADFTVEIEDITAKLEQEKINAESLAYLASTDWMIIRESETGVVCPVEIKKARQAARDRIIK